MADAKVLRNERVVLTHGRFVVEIKAYEVPASKRYPEGVKVRCVLVDTELGKPRVLLDNHEPFGFHLHSRLPDDPDFRVSLEIEDYNEAIRVFFSEVRKVVSDEA